MTLLSVCFETPST